jgi:hypothetical protein
MENSSVNRGTMVLEGSPIVSSTLWLMYVSTEIYHIIIAINSRVNSEQSREIIGGE